ncbi:MAG: cyclase family protein [SAR202 cluster bacterium]|jgi:kynurenine formamidase|uniref:Cyclase family protein n=1 Tax=marine metagenome TaxID=408172 RepID=A0A382EKE7_9ZZZZ|nr:cyclase family protein [Dehalococcoidia bacterium]MQF87819.1 cyclase family protein [SAR202 cluster bacterium]|tara:strand:- start:3121 stop:3795 length:675 start_codon:yes stop_codon:yes gene_type:complete
MSELIDLTLTLGSERISLVPGLVGVETSSIQTHATHARSNQKLCLATHIGTHVDAPFHFVDGATTVENMPLNKYAGPAILLDLRSVAKGQSPLLVSELTDAGANPASVKDQIIILFTGWAEAESGGPRFYGHGPYLSTDGAAYLAECGANAVAVDFPIDKHPETPETTIKDFPVHRLLLGQNIPLIENLINLDKLVGKEFELWALPLKLQGGDGAATRAVARIL